MPDDLTALKQLLAQMLSKVVHLEKMRGSVSVSMGVNPNKQSIRRPRNWSFLIKPKVSLSLPPKRRRKTSSLRTSAVENASLCPQIHPVRV